MEAQLVHYKKSTPKLEAYKDPEGFAIVSILFKVNIGLRLILNNLDDD